MVEARKFKFVVATSIDSIYARQSENRRVEACATYSLVPSHTINAKDDCGAKTTGTWVWHYSYLCL